MKHLPTVRKGHASMARTMEHPFNSVPSVPRMMTDMFEWFSRDLGEIRLPSMERFWKEPGLISTKFDISETKDAYNITAELPGLEEKDIELTMDHDNLVLSGEKKQEKEEKKKNYFFSESSYGQYYRSIPMPWGVDSEKIKATFRKGVLRVNLPKTEIAKMERRKVKITCD
ncbi:MAG TPA: hypothetical protein DET40_12135 [Lentisphaeria bacterium]|nr:MAG: hypothetical protein A2X45_07685 [Lentisphaerae bacterium GWF2_50_93]HCE44289.1 hypothetical protein [Lentisphaeria bacterium]